MRYYLTIVVVGEPDLIVVFPVSQIYRPLGSLEHTTDPLLESSATACSRRGGVAGGERLLVRRRRAHRDEKRAGAID